MIREPTVKRQVIDNYQHEKRRVSIIIISYNTAKVLDDCIASIFGSHQEKFEFIVIDNASADNSVAMLESKYPEVILIHNSKNVGFGKANNQGIRFARGKFILLLNSDTLFHDSSITKLADFMEKTPDVIIAGPKLLNHDLTFQPQCKRGFPKFFNSIGYFTGLSAFFPNCNLLAGYLDSPNDPDRPHEVEVVSGACLMISRCGLDELGMLFDERYFMHFEDIDLCHRARGLGFKIQYLPSAEVVHLKGKSSKTRLLGVRSNLLDSARVYFRRNYKKENILAYLLAIIALEFIHLLHRIHHAYSVKGKPLVDFRTFRQPSQVIQA